jgi:hypothetical protein
LKTGLRVLKSRGDVSVRQRRPQGEFPENSAKMPSAKEERVLTESFYDKIIEDWGLCRRFFGQNHGQQNHFRPG